MCNQWLFKRVENMAFQKGHKLARGGKRQGAGRKSKEERAIKKAAGEIAREYIEKRIAPLMESYFKLIKGRIVKHYDKEGNLISEEEVIDSAAVRHAVDTVVPKRAPEDAQGNTIPGYYQIVPPE
jgi:hypothetical protein